MQEINTPTSIVVFGATGDLHKRKLIPALFDLYVRGLLPDDFSLIGFARRTLTQAEYQSLIRESLNGRSKQKAVDDFLQHAYYHTGDFSDVEALNNLGVFMHELDEKRGQCSNKLYYLAVPPRFYESLLHNLAASGLSIGCGPDSGWARLAIEKPFGRNLDTAQSLDNLLKQLFDEEQIFRIDHYLAKETIDNILTFRFANNIFAPIWNSEYIEKVTIKLHETIGVAGRGAFYDDIGALRDVGENHALQLLTLIAMEDPGSFDAASVRYAREQVLNALLLDTSMPVEKKQYANYLAEEGVAEDSLTETYFQFTTLINNDRWRGVPFEIEAGKKLPTAKTEITVYFKPNGSEFARGFDEGEQSKRNIIKFSLQPDENIGIQFLLKESGFAHQVKTEHLNFEYDVERDSPSAYEKVLLSVFSGDQTLFVSSGEIEASWKFITPILETWKDSKPILYD